MMCKLQVSRSDKVLGQDFIHWRFCFNIKNFDKCFLCRYETKPYQKELHLYAL